MAIPDVQGQKLQKMCPSGSAGPSWLMEAIPTLGLLDLPLAS